MASEPAKVYVDESKGKDAESQSGSEGAPYQSLSYAFIQKPPDGGREYFMRKSELDESGQSILEWKPAAKSAMKKASVFFEQHKKKKAKSEELALREKQEQESRQKTLEAAKQVKLTEDASLPKAIKIHLNEKDPSKIKLRSGDSSKEVDYSSGHGTRVRITGRIHRLRSQKGVIFITLYDGYGFLQCVLTGDLIKTYDAMTFTAETALEVFGEMWEVPPKQHAPDDRELHVDYYEVIGRAAGDKEAITTRVAEGADQQTLLDNRHLNLRGEQASSLMKVRAALLRAFRRTYEEIEPSCLEVTPPCMVQTQVEGGATLFEFQYYQEKAFLTQSSQLYLETCLASLGNVFCVAPSFRAEKSLTRRHLSEYTHIEAELDFIKFPDLLDHLEHVMCSVIDTVLANPSIKFLIYSLNPDFKVPERPFTRMRYSEAITWLRDHEIPDEEGRPHEFGTDIAEAAERKMTDIIGKPIFLTHFPVETKAFYMKKDPEDRQVTESVDCLMPGVGEIVGGSMRMEDYHELMEAYEREGIDPKPYYWYTDQRKYVWRCLFSQSKSANLLFPDTVHPLMVATDLV